MKAYTKGEWVYHDYSCSVIIKDSGSKGAGYPPTPGTIASLDDGEYIINDNKYDGYLIAAAPDLYETLKSIEKYWSGGNLSRDPRLWRKMRSVLAKARGEYIDK